MEPQLEVLVHGRGNLLARSGNVVVQVRSGEMTESVLGRLESALTLLRVSARGPVGCISIVEEGASLVPAEIRAKQAKVVRDLLREERAYFAAAVVGESVSTRAVRTVMRLLLLNVPRLHTTATADDAAAWLAKRLGNVTYREVRSIAERARALAREQP